MTDVAVRDYVSEVAEAAVSELTETARKAAEISRDLDGILTAKRAAFDHHYLKPMEEYRDEVRMFVLAGVHRDMSKALTRMLPLVGPNWNDIRSGVRSDMRKLLRAYRSITTALSKDLPGDLASLYDMGWVFFDLSNFILGRNHVLSV